MKGDVYPVEPYDGSMVNQVLDAHWGVLYDGDVSALSLPEFFVTRSSNGPCDVMFKSLSPVFSNIAPN